MDTRRLLLYGAFGLIAFMLWNQWRAEHPMKPPAPASTPAAASVSAPGAAAPASAGSTGASLIENHHPQAATLPSLKAPAGPRIHIHTDVLDLSVALDGGEVTRAALLKYPSSLHSKQSVDLLTPGSKGQSALMLRPELSGAELPSAPVFSATASDYTLAPGAGTLRVPLSWSANGVTLIRTLVLKRGSYAVRIETRIENQSKHTLDLTPGVTLIGANPPVAEHFWQHMLPKYYAFRGPAYFNADDGYEKTLVSKLAETPLDKQFAGGWIAGVRQYFVAVAIPPAADQARYFGRAIDGGYVAGYRLAPVKVTAGASSDTAMQLFLGPKKQGLLKQIAPGLPRTVDYGHATIICKPIFSVLSFIHGILGNWGWSIIILVLLIKALFYYPQRMSARSMAKMRKLQPRIKLLRERYKDDRQKLSQATMDLYRQEGANPVSGCLPMLIQFPIFIGLFYVLIYSVELRQAPWILWIHDLSQPDPLFILPIVYAVLSFVQFRLQPQAMEGAQAKMMMVMPLLFAFFYSIFPAGLVLYYSLSTGLNIAIQYRVNHELGMKGLGILPKIDWPWKKNDKG
ncbi:MAG: membrane protein insertase YidC [Gammaproteobacteria bacterium]